MIFAFATTLMRVPSINGIVNFNQRKVIILSRSRQRRYTLCSDAGNVVK